MKMRKLWVGCIAISATVTCCYSCCAYAQAEAPAQPAAGVSGGLEEIIVTAQKRSEDVQRVPVAVSAISSATIEAANISTIDQLSSLLPGLQVTHTSDGAQPFLRGIGTNSSALGNEAAVATYVDGVYRASPAGSIFSYNNIERIEVLFGPQGTLFGRNAAGGVVNIITKDPTFEPTMKAEVGYANYNTVSGNLYASGGLSQNIAADIALLYTNQLDGWGKNFENGRDVFLNNEGSVRSKVLFTPGSSTRITLIADYDRNRGDEGAVDSVTPGHINNFGYAHAGGFWDTASNIDGYNIQEQEGVSLKVEQDLAWAQLSNISAWRTVRSPSLQELDGSPALYLLYDENEKQRTITEELNLQSESSSRVKWIGGFFYFNDSSQYDPLLQQGTAYGLGPTGGFEINSKQDTTSYAGYGQATVPLFTDSTHFTAGLRYTSDEKSITAARSLLGSGAPASYNFPAGFPFSVRQPKTTYKASLDHSFTDDILTYASYSTGFKSGNYNLTKANQPPTDPETLDAYEVGVKSELFDRMVRANAAAFYYKFHDLQVSSFVGTSTVLTNAAEAEYKGLEAEVTIAPTKELSFNAGATYIDSSYLSYKNAVYVSTLPSGGISAAYIGDATGNQVLFVDKFTASAGAQYTTKQRFGVLTGQFGANYHHGFFFDAQNFTPQPSYTTLDANLTLRLPSSRVSIAFWGKNLTDAEYYVTRASQAGTGDLYSPAAPRTFGVRFGYEM
jgi:iron complex outermembrane receptor protein